MKKQVIIIILVFTALALSTPNSTDKTPPKNAASASSPQSSLTDQQLWALGCSAMLIERNHERHDLLGADFENPKTREECKQFLVVSGWGVKNRKDLLDSLIFLERGGHRRGFNDMGQKLLSLSYDQYRNLLDQYQTDKETLFTIKVVAHYYPILGKKSLLGWDYTRYICLCRWGYLAGYLSEQEAWQKIMPAAKLLQRTFSSWQDLGQNYLIGRKFWDYQETKDWAHQIEDAYMRLNDLPSSPWNKLPWNLDLSK